MFHRIEQADRKASGVRQKADQETGPRHCTEYPWIALQDKFAELFPLKTAIFLSHSANLESTLYKTSQSFCALLRADLVLPLATINTSKNLEEVVHCLTRSPDSVGLS